MFFYQGKFSVDEAAFGIGVAENRLQKEDV
jgi:hypothetical protein